MVQTIKVPGRYADGGGLYLVVDPRGRRWVYRYTIDGKTRDMGLGSARDVTLASAREAAEAARRQVGQRTDPVEARRQARSVRTFREVAEDYIASQEPGLRNAKHIAQWRYTLHDLAGPIGHMPIDRVDTDAVLSVLRPIWTTTPETASRLRGRIERVLASARARGERSGENPAQWRGHLDHLLPRHAATVRSHHAAMAYAEIPGFVQRLRSRPSVSAFALEWTIYTAARTGETIGARWAEIDREARVWTVPADRMKGAREHRVPLGERCLVLLDQVAEIGGPWLFPGSRGKPISQMAMLMLLRDMAPGLTVHGFRSTFRDWAGDATNWPREVIEGALAHRVGDSTERAYRRQDALDKRRRLMDAWDGYLAGDGAGNVVRLKTG
jgi:integrase